MKTRPRATSAQILTLIAAAPADVSQVYIPDIYAGHFHRVPKDGRDYFVRDPKNRHVVHWTRADGSFERIDETKLALKVEIKSTRFGSPKPRLAGQGRLAKSRVVKPQATPEICLIDLQRVMQICGFRRSFVYERADFPKPIRLGTAQRSAVRWVESEIVAWTRAQVAVRDLTAA